MFRGEESVSSLQTRKVDKNKTKHGMFQPILICGWRDVQNWKSLLWSRIINKILAKQLKLSRYAEEEKHCIHLMLLGEIVSNLRRLQRWKC